MILRFNKPVSFFAAWAKGSDSKAVLISNLRFREHGRITTVIGPATYFIHFLSELSGTYDLDSIIVDPAVT